MLMEGIALNSTADVKTPANGKPGAKIGNRTECALLQLCLDMGCDWQHERQSTRMLRVFPFSSDRKRMSVLTLPEGAQ